MNTFIRQNTDSKDTQRQIYDDDDFIGMAANRLD